ncbi:MAG: ABC transporter permease [Planctomycetota bacterium]
MNRIFAIAQRELTAMVVTKAFLASLILMPVLMAGGVLVLPLIGKIEGGKERKFAIVDHGGGELVAVLQAAADARNAQIEQQKESDEAAEGLGVLDGNSDTYRIENVDAADFDDAGRLEYSKRVIDGDLYAFVELPKTLTDNPTDDVTLRYVSTSGNLSELRGWIRNVLRLHLRAKQLASVGVDANVVAAAEPKFSVVATRPFVQNPDGSISDAKEEDEAATILAPMAMMGLMFLVIFLAAQPMLESAMEEKTQKISEVMLGNVSPSELLTGKLLGNVAGSMIVFAMYAVGGYIILSSYDMTDLLPVSMIGWFIVFQLLGVLLFSSVFMVIGASVNQLKEAQSLLIPVWLVLMAPLMIWIVIVRDPNGIVATASTFFPPAAPLTAMLRLGTGAAIPAWQLPTAALLLLATTLVIVWLAARIYRASLLRSDSATTILQILRRAT